MRVTPAMLPFLRGICVLSLWACIYTVQAQDVRYQRDAQFGNKGNGTVHLGHEDDVYRNHFIEKDSEGRIVSMLMSQNPNVDIKTCTIYLTRTFPNGETDQSFGQDGVFEFNVGEYFFGEEMPCYVNDLKLHHDTIFLFGFLLDPAYNDYCTPQIAVMKILPDGLFDVSFADSGIYVHQELLTKAASGLVATNGDVLIGGEFEVQSESCGSEALGCMIRLESSGILDVDFGTNGTLKFQGDSGTYNQYSHLVGPIQEIIELKDESGYMVGGGVLAIRKVDTSGHIDSSFFQENFEQLYYFNDNANYGDEAELLLLSTATNGQALAYNHDYDLKFDLVNLGDTLFIVSVGGRLEPNLCTQYKSGDGPNTYVYKFKANGSLDSSYYNEEHGTYGWRWITNHTNYLRHWDSLGNMYSLGIPSESTYDYLYLYKRSPTGEQVEVIPTKFKLFLARDSLESVFQPEQIVADRIIDWFFEDDMSVTLALNNFWRTDANHDYPRAGLKRFALNGIDREKICDGDSSLIGGEYCKKPGIYYSNNGSPVYLDVQSTFSNNHFHKTCIGDTVSIGNSQIVSGGLYIDTSLSNLGCDTINYHYSSFRNDVIDREYETSCGLLNGTETISWDTNNQQQGNCIKSTITQTRHFPSSVSELRSNNAMTWYFGDKIELNFSNGNAVVDSAEQGYNGDLVTIYCDNTGEMKVFDTAIVTNLIFPLPRSKDFIVVKRRNNHVNYDYPLNVELIPDKVGNYELYKGHWPLQSLGYPYPKRNGPQYIEGCEHRDGENYWLVGLRNKSRGIYVRKISQGGAEELVEYDMKKLKCNEQYLISPSSDHLVYSFNKEGVCYYHMWRFNNSTGKPHHPVTFLGLGKKSKGHALSPNGRVLYTVETNSSETNTRLVQYNITTRFPKLIESNAQIIADDLSLEIDELKLGPNGKIYILEKDGQYLHVINKPNLEGAACDFVENGLYLQGKESTSNFPRFVSSFVNNTPELGIMNSCLGDTATVYNTINQALSNTLVIDESVVATQGKHQASFDYMFSEPGFHDVQIISNYDCFSDTIQDSLFIDSACYTVFFDTICFEDSVLWDSSFVTKSGLYTDTLIASNGEDSLVRLVLTKSDSMYSDTSIQLLVGDSVNINGIWQTQSGIYLDTFQTSSGCDSIVETTLQFDSTLVQEPDTCWNTGQKIVHDDRQLGDFFGTVVAIEDDWAFASSLDDLSGSEINAGAVYAFKKDTSWTQVQKIVPGYRSEEESFGNRIAVDGDQLMICNAPASGDTIKVYYFQLIGNSWQQQQIITDGLTNKSPTSIDIEDGYAYVGVSSQGKVLVYELSNNTWSLDQTITGSSGNRFGVSVAVEDDLLAVGAFWDDLDANGQNNLNKAGSVKLYTRQGQSAWSYDSKAVSPNRVANGYFGWDVDLMNGELLVGSYKASVGSLNSAGAVYRLVKDTAWNTIQTILPQESFTGGIFGYNLDADSGKLAVGHRRYSGTFNSTTLTWEGAAHLFVLNDSNEFEESELFLSTNRTAGHEFGVDIAMSGSSLIVGTFFDETDENNANTLSQSGAAHIFDGDCDPVLVTYTYDSIEVELCDGDSTYAGGAWQTTSGQYVDTVSLDTIKITTISVISSIQTTDTISWCSGDSIMVHGNMVGQAGEYTENYIAVNGCDSVSTVIIENGSSSYDFILNWIYEGDSVFLAGAFQTVADIYLDTFPNQSGCDSIVETMLWVYPVETGTDSITICSGDSIELGGILRTTAGTYTDTNMLGGTAHINQVTLFVNTPSNINTSLSIAQGDSVLLGGIYRTASGTYCDTIGVCDTINCVTLTVGVSSYVTISDSVEICDGDSHLAGETYYMQSGIYQDTIGDGMGVDTIYITDLLVDALNSVPQIYSSGFWLKTNMLNPPFLWYNCDSGVVTSTTQVPYFQPGFSASFAIINPASVCGDTSECIFHSNTANKVGMHIKGYPTNAITNYTVEFESEQDEIQFVLYDIQGRVLDRFDRENQRKVEIDLEEFASGLYLLQVETSMGIETLKFVKVIDY